MYLWSCNQSLALKHAFIGQQVNGTVQNSRILRITDLHWCSNITWQYLGTFSQHFFCMHYWLHDFLPVSSTFFQFFPVSSRRNWKKYLFSSFFHSSWKKPISSGSFRTLIGSTRFNQIFCDKYSNTGRMKRIGGFCVLQTPSNWLYSTNPDESVQ